MVTKKEYEKLEGVFHDALGSYFELVVLNALVANLGLELPQLDVTLFEAKMSTCIDELKRAGDDRWELLSREKTLVGESGAQAVSNLLARPELSGMKVVGAAHTAAAFAGGNAGDIRLDLSDGRSLPVSCKTDKSGKVALADLGQTSLERAADGFYGVGVDELEALAQETLGKTVREVKESYYTTSHLWRLVMIDRLGILGAEINDFSAARATSTEGVRRLMGRVVGSIHGNDDALLLVISRKDGSIGGGTSMDALDPSLVEPEEISFTAGRPKGDKPVGTTLGIKWRAPGESGFVTVFDHQVKPRRGANPSEAFRDITTRVKT